MTINSRKLTTRSATALALMLAARGVFADLSASVSYTSGVYVQNFNSLATYNPNTTTWSNLTSPPVPVDFTQVTLPTLNAAVGAPIDMTGPSADFFQTIGTISTMTGWQAVNWQGNSSPLQYTVSNGGTSSATTALTGYFDPARQVIGNTGTANNMSLGVQTASVTGNVLFGVRLVNNSTGSLNAISVSFLGELFHQDANQKVLKFGYYVGSATSNSDIFTDIPPVGQAIIPNQVGSLAATFDTSAAANSTASYSISNLPLATAWAPGQALWLTWEMDRGGGGQGIGIDDLSFSASNLSAFPTLTWNHAGNGTWDQAAANWSGASTTFSNGFNASFGNITSDTAITINSSGVSVTSLVTLGNSANTYTFSGGPISGANASLTVAGGGTVKLTAPNSYGLATNLNAGTLIVDNNNQLGAAAATLQFGGGTLLLQGDLVAGTRPLNVLAQGGKINLNGHNATFGAATTAPVLIVGTLQVSGAGDLNLGVQPTIGSNGGTGALVIDAGSTVTLQGFARGTATDIFVNSTINGVMILNSFGNIGGSRFNFNSSGSTTVSGSGASATMTHSGMNGASVISGTGEIDIPWGSKWIKPTTGGTALSDGSSASNFVTGGVVISNTSGANGGNIGVNIHLNSLEGTSGHPTFIRTDVTNSKAFSTNSTAGLASDFITVIGGTKNNGTGKGGIGPNFAELIISGVISGDSDINIGNDYKSGGSGNVLLMNHNTYHGVTMLNGGGTGTPVLYIGVDNALPTDTDLVFSSISGAGSPALDLSGHNQTVQSLSVAGGTNSPLACVIDNSGPAPSTLTISGAVTPFWSYAGQINDQGPLGTDVLGSNFTAYGGSTVSLIKDGPSTFVLGKYNDNGSGHHSFSTYSGGTTARGGILSIAFDGALGAASGPLTLDGGTVQIEGPDLLYTVEQSLTWNTTRPLTVTANGGTINTPTFTSMDNASVAHPLVASIIMNNTSYSWGGNLTFNGAPGSNVTLNGATSVTVLPTGKITISPNVTLTLDGPTDPATDTLSPTKHLSFTDNGNLQITGSVNKTLGTVTGTGNVSQLGTGTTTLSKTMAISGSLSISAGKLALTADGSSHSTPALDLGSLSITGTAKLDMKDRDAIIRTVPDPVAFANLITTGKITSSTATPGNGGQTLGYGPAGQIGGIQGHGLTSFDGTPVTANNMIVRYTTPGDVTLDGKSDSFDLLAILNNFGASYSDPTWWMGDVTGDGKVDSFDLLAVLNNFGNLVGGTFDPLDTSPAAGGATPSATPVPEPASLAVLALGAICLLARRKHLA